MPEEPATTPKPLALLPIAEIRASIQDRRSQYPVALRGLNVRSLFFYEDPDSGLHRRRYMPGGGDPERGVFPLEQARGDMGELQHVGNSAHLIVWEFFTAEEFAAAEKQKREALEAAEAREQARVAALKQAREEESQAAEKIEVLQKPGAIVPDESEGKKSSGKLKAALDRIGGK